MAFFVVSTIGVFIDVLVIYPTPLLQWNKTMSLRRKVLEVAAACGVRRRAAANFAHKQYGVPRRAGC